jgi:hypothetical protein
MKFGTLTFLTTVILLCVLPIPVRLAAQNASSEVITFDAPGANSIAGSLDGTFPGNINNGGTITGIYVDSNNVSHGFLRTPAGEFITLNAPGTGTSVGTRFRAFPSGININSRGTITGNYVDSNNVSHGFLRTPAGEFITLDAPGASSAAGSLDGTFPNSINNGGTVTGYYIDSKDMIHGFLRSPGGEFTTFDAPGAGTVPAFGYGTFPKSINDAGAITGYYGDADGMYHGFLRSLQGEFTTFDAPGASTAAGSGNGILPKSINAGGAITGHYADARNVNHGFLRSPGREVTTFDAPGAGTSAGSGWGTFPDSINDAGAITGHYTDAHGLNHGFLLIP